jgi:hypothetical protein
MACVALWRAFLHTMKCSFLMISPKLHDFSPFFFLTSSPLGTADFLVLLELSGDGYSLLCSKKEPTNHHGWPPASADAAQLGNSSIDTTGGVAAGPLRSGPPERCAAAAVPSLQRTLPSAGTVNTFLFYLEIGN